MQSYHQIRLPARSTPDGEIPDFPTKTAAQFWDGWLGQVAASKMDQHVSTAGIADGAGASVRLPQPIVPTPEALAWVRSRMIAFAKRKDIT
jgi:hypothetical protein